MKITNQSEQEIAVAPSLLGPIVDPKMIMKPGETIHVEDVHPGFRVIFASTPEGLRVAIFQEAWHLMSDCDY